MSGFFRPEAMAALMRWREVLAGAAILALAFYWMLATRGLLAWVGAALIPLAGLAVYAGIQRVRFRAGHGGPGWVQVDEGQVSYFGPLDGGIRAVADLDALILDPSGTPPVWVLRQMGQSDLAIPVNAEGADALFDAFAVLPGLRTEFMLAQLAQSPDHPVVIWQSPDAASQAVTLH